MREFEFVLSGRYRVIVGDKNGGVQIYIHNSAAANELRTNLIYSYDGITWIRASGMSVHKKKGMDKLTLSYIAKVVGLDEEVIKAIKSFFEVRRYEQQEN